MVAAPSHFSGQPGEVLNILVAAPALEHWVIPITVVILFSLFAVQSRGTARIGAVFAAMNTMYRVVASRTREIGTLRAIGFSRGAILISFVLESAVIGVIGGALGCLLASTVHGYSTSTSNLQSFSEIAFAFAITPQIIAASMSFALAMGVLGGLLPAARAAALPIAEAIRES